VCVCALVRQLANHPLPHGTPQEKRKTSVGSVDDMEVVLVGMLKEAHVAAVYDPGFGTIQESSPYNSFVDADLCLSSGCSKHICIGAVCLCQPTVHY